MSRTYLDGKLEWQRDLENGRVLITNQTITDYGPGQGEVLKVMVISTGASSAAKALPLDNGIMPLIEAAPELLEVAKEAVKFLDDGTPENSMSLGEMAVIKALDAAIAKAQDADSFSRKLASVEKS